MRMFLFLLLALVLPAGAQPKLHPIDEASKDPQLADFRKRLLAVVERRDLQGLQPFLSSDFQYSFGMDKPGPAGFLKFFKAQEKEMWPQLERVLKNGGSFDKRHVFYAPFTSANWPKGYDEFKWKAVLGKDVPIYASADEKSQQLTVLSMCMVELSTVESDFDRSPEGWIPVMLPKAVQEGRKLERGFMRVSELTSPIGYRSTFEKRKGAWKLTSFIAGD